MIELALQEVRDLHTFFESWLAGTGPSDTAHFGRLDQALGPGFEMIPPSGQCVSRSQLIESLQPTHGARGKNFRLWVRELSGRELSKDLVLVTYEEWQNENGVDRGRRSSAILHVDVKRSQTCLWLHVHETWLP